MATIKVTIVVTRVNCSKGRTVEKDEERESDRTITK